MTQHVCLARRQGWAGMDGQEERSVGLGTVYGGVAAGWLSVKCARPVMCLQCLAWHTLTGQPAAAGLHC
jgi:hypothetical protein